MRLDNGYFVKIAALFAIYFITARFGLSIQAVSGFATLIWLPSGISVAAFLISGLELAPAVFLGAFTANFITGAPLVAALAIGAGNTLEPFLAAFILKKFFKFRNTLDRLKDVLALTFIASILCTLISPTIGVISLWLVDTIQTQSVTSAWLTWWIGDMISILIIAPFLLVWSTQPKIYFSFKKVIEALLILTLFVIIYFSIFTDSFALLAKNNPTAYIVFPPLVWAAVSFGLPGAVTAIFILSASATVSTLQAFGPFATTVPTGNLLALQIFMAVTSVTTMILAAVITERRHSEEAKDEFISVAAHEFKTPLTTLKGYTQLLSQEFKKTASKKSVYYLSNMNAQIDNLTRLIADLFDVSRIQTGRFQLQMEIIDLDNLVKKVVTDMQNLSKIHKIKIVGSTRKKIFADQQRLSQVLMNIISNAIKFSPRNGDIQMFLSSNKAYVTISVHDLGIGISSRDINHIFERFFQAKTNIRKSTAGLGLGLYISAEIIKQHKGRIWVTSKKGAGSTFSFSLPTRNNNL